jgi:hypothetical protein
MSGAGNAIGSALERFLLKSHAMGRTGIELGKVFGKSAYEAAPGLVRDNPRLAMAALGLGGLGAGIGGEELIHESPEHARHAEMEILKRRAGERLRMQDPNLGPLFDEEER